MCAGLHIDIRGAHSLRSRHITQSIRAGVPGAIVMLQSRYQNVAVFRKYVRHGASYSSTHRRRHWECRGQLCSPARHFGKEYFLRSRFRLSLPKQFACSSGPRSHGPARSCKWAFAQDISPTGRRVSFLESRQRCKSSRAACRGAWISIPRSRRVGAQPEKPKFRDVQRNGERFNDQSRRKEFQ